MDIRRVDDQRTHYFRGPARFVIENNQADNRRQQPNNALNNVQAETIHHQISKVRSATRKSDLMTLLRVEGKVKRAAVFTTKQECQCKVFKGVFGRTEAVVQSQRSKIREQELWIQRDVNEEPTWQFPTLTSCTPLLAGL